MRLYPFNRGSGPIRVDAQITGPNQSLNLSLILDTGATTSLINRTTLLYLGFDPAQPAGWVTLTTGSTTQAVPLFVATRLSALGQHRIGFRVIAHDLPAGSAADGLLGLDFLRDQVLTVDFRTGMLGLS